MTVRPSRTRLLTAAALTLLTFAFYAWHLSGTPVYLNDAEVFFALHVHAMTKTLHDANGRLLPLYFQIPQIGENVWFQPMLVYVSTPFLKILPLTEWSIRLPTVCLGVIDVVLMYLVARRVFASRGWGLFAAALLATTPAHFIHSRVALDYIYPVPFVLGWLWAMVRFEEDGQPKWIGLAALVLGAGFFSYLGGAMLMPVFFVMTCAYVLLRRRRFDRAIWVAAAAFALPLLLLVVWVTQHPSMIQETVGRYGVQGGTGRLSAIRQFVSYSRLQDYTAMYWQMSSPVYLFMVGSSNWINSTRQAGVFLLPIAIFVVAGLVDLVREPESRIKWLLLAGAVVAPIGAVFVGEAYAIERELELLRFVVLLATFGARMMLQSTSALSRAAAAAALVVGVLQFGHFTRDYFGDYRLNSLGWFGTNVRGTVAEVLRERQSTPPDAIYLSDALPFAVDNWKLYLAMNGHEDWWPRLRSFDAKKGPGAVPRGSLVIEPMPDVPVPSAEFTQTAVVVAPEGGTRYVVLERR